MSSESHCRPLPGCRSAEIDEPDAGAPCLLRPDAGRRAPRMPVLGDPACPGCCPACGSDAAYRWGKSEAGVARRRCRSCGRTYSWRTGTLVAGIRQPAKFAAVLDDMLTGIPTSCRRLAKQLGTDKMTIWNWRHRIINSLVSPAPDAPDQRVDALAGPIRESRKGSREWVDHRRDPTRHPAPNRPRWVDIDSAALPLPQPLVDYQLRLMIGSDGQGCRPAVAPVRCPSAASRFRNLCCALVTESDAAARCSTHTAGARASPVPGPDAGAADHVVRQLGVAGTSVLHDALAAFLRPFAGPAAKHLEAYLAWFVARLECSLSRGAAHFPTTHAA